MDKDVKELLDRLVAVQELQTKQQNGNGLHTKTPADFGTHTELHGDGSLWGNQSIERDVVSAHVRPRGILSRLPVIPSVFTNPFYATLTGYTDVSGSEATNPCDDNPAGFVKGCYLTAQFGRYARDTQTIEINDVMLRKNRGDFTDLILRGQVLGDLGPAGTPAGMNQSDILNLVTKSEMVTATVALQRLLSTQVWQGTPSNNTSGGGYKEMPGLDSQIATGQVDAETNSACPALDSDVKNFAYDAIDGSGRDIVEYLSSMEFYLRTFADDTGLSPVTWAFVMRPELWFELSAVWPCRYLTHRCQTDTAANPMVINDNVNVSARDAMRNGMYIDVNGNRYPVITDYGIFEHNNINNGNLGLGQYASTIYMVPLTIAGGFPVTYLEHVDYRAASRDVNMLRGTQEFWTDDGRYYWAAEYIKWCYKLSVKIEPRVVLRTPQLAGRIDAVQYEPLQHLMSPYPDSPYFQDGGASLRADETTYAVWK